MLIFDRKSTKSLIKVQCRSFSNRFSKLLRKHCPGDQNKNSMYYSKVDLGKNPTAIVILQYIVIRTTILTDFPKNVHLLFLFGNYFYLELQKESKIEFLK